ncbi:hypothetical protein ACVBEH_03470 [Roseateles sp. GG27B]
MQLAKPIRLGAALDTARLLISGLQGNKACAPDPIGRTSRQSRLGEQALPARDSKTTKPLPPIRLAARSEAVLRCNFIQTLSEPLSASAEAQ